MSWLLKIATVAAMTVGAASIAAADAIEDRQALMKDVVSPAARLATATFRGQVPFDGPAIAEAMRAVAEVPEPFAAMFPEGTSAEDDPLTTANAAIWTDTEEFRALLDEFRKASLAVKQGAEAGPESFNSAFADFAGQCRACHQRFRVPR